MPPEHLDLSSSVTSARGGFEHRKSLAEVLGIRFVSGAAISTLPAAVWICSRPTRNYPATVACGGIFVIAFQVGLLLIAVSAVQLLTGRLAEQRRSSITVCAGSVCAALVFVLPPVVGLVTSSNWAVGISTLSPLVGGPLLSAFIVVKLTGQKAA